MKSCVDKYLGLGRSCGLNGNMKTVGIPLLIVTRIDRRENPMGLDRRSTALNVDMISASRSL